MPDKKSSLRRSQYCGPVNAGSYFVRPGTQDVATGRDEPKVSGVGYRKSPVSIASSGMIISSPVVVVVIVLTLPTTACTELIDSVLPVSNTNGPCAA